MYNTNERNFQARFHERFGVSRSKLVLKKFVSIYIIISQNAREESRHFTCLHSNVRSTVYDELVYSDSVQFAQLHHLQHRFLQ